MTMKGWQEDDESTDIRTRDLARRQRDIMDGARPWGAYPSHIGKPCEPTLPPLQAHPRRTDWHRVAQGTVVLLALAAASAALIVAGALLLRSL